MMNSMSREEQINHAWATHTHNKMRAEGQRVIWTREKGLKERLSEQQNHRCCFCGERFDPNSKQKRATFEHVVPLRKGGKDAEVNLALSCAKDNTLRGSVLYWPPRPIGHYGPEYAETFLDPELYTEGHKSLDR